MEYSIDTSDNRLNQKLSELIDGEIETVRNFVNEAGIKTIYLPIDGTRRYFIEHTGIDYSHPDFFKEYFDFTITAMVELLEMIYDHGIDHVIILLMDRTAFQRDKRYLDNAIKLGITPVIEHEEFIQFYNEYDIHPVFGGYNEIYKELGYQVLYDSIMDINSKATAKELTRTLTFYTAPLQEFDIFKYLNDGEQVSDLKEEDIYRYLYPVNVPDIDFSIFYGYPRDKVQPQLLGGKSVNFFTPNPSLGLSPIQLRKTIFYFALTLSDIKDNYIQYTSDKVASHVKHDNKTILAEDSYIN